MGKWIRLDVGLLDDEGWSLMPEAVQAAWIKAYLLQAARDGVPFQTEGELIRLLRKEGVTDPEKAVAQMRHMLDAEDDGPQIGIRRYGEHQPVARGPSDSPEYKRGYMAGKRSHRLPQTPTVGHETTRTIPTDDAGASARVPERLDPKQALVDAGVDPSILEGKKAGRKIAE